MNVLLMLDLQASQNQNTNRSFFHREGKPASRSFREDTGHRSGGSIQHDWAVMHLVVAQTWTSPSSGVWEENCLPQVHQANVKISKQ